jgi:hypothetical protein
VTLVPDVTVTGPTVNPFVPVVIVKLLDIVVLLIQIAPPALAVAVVAEPVTGDPPTCSEPPLTLIAVPPM